MSCFTCSSSPKTYVDKVLKISQEISIELIVFHSLSHLELRMNNFNTFLSKLFYGYFHFYHHPQIDINIFHKNIKQREENEN